VASSISAKPGPGIRRVGVGRGLHVAASARDGRLQAVVQVDPSAVTDAVRRAAEALVAAPARHCQRSPDGQIGRLGHTGGGRSLHDLEPRRQRWKVWRGRGVRERVRMVDLGREGDGAIGPLDGAIG
jgi:hypothetical protein